METRARTLTHDDVKQILEMQLICFPKLAPESAESFINKIDYSPDTCWGIFEQGQLKAYLISLPWTLQSPLALNQVHLDGRNSNCLYLHDISVLPEMRGTGAAQQMLSLFFHALEHGPYHHAALVAVQGSKPFWQKHGFITKQTSAEMTEKLSSYGSDACYMEYNA